MGQREGEEVEGDVLASVDAVHSETGTVCAKYYLRNRGDQYLTLVCIDPVSAMVVGSIMLHKGSLSAIAAMLQEQDTI